MSEDRNVVVYANELAEEARAAGADWQEARKQVQKRALENHPTYIGMVTAVTHNDKTDRYMVKFDHGTLKATNEVAIFLLTEVFHVTNQGRPIVYAHIDDQGVMDGVLLMFLTREGRQL